MKPRSRIFLGWVALLIPLGVTVADVPKPNIPVAKGEACVEPTDVMRSHHMDFILHQRDETMHWGIRTPRYSLEGCLECHVQPDENGDFARYPSEKHFCNSCHAYTGVKIDCFQCHNDLPQKSRDDGED